MDKAWDEKIPDGYVRIMFCECGRPVVAEHPAFPNRVGISTSRVKPYAFGNLYYLCGSPLNIRRDRAQG